MSLQLYLAFVAACLVLAIVPGPIVTLLVANGLRHGTRAALVNIAGAQVGLAISIGIVAVGLTSMMATMGYWFDWVRFAGAAYLVWIGLKMLRSPGLEVTKGDAPPPPKGGFFLQGLVVLLSNPKMLIFFGAFIPQFVDLEKPHLPQVMLLGVTFMVIAGATDAINYEKVNVREALLELTGGRGPDACIDAVGMEAHGHGIEYAYDRGKQLACKVTVTATGQSAWYRTASRFVS